MPAWYVVLRETNQDPRSPGEVRMACYEAVDYVDRLRKEHALQARTVEVIGEIADTWRAMRRTWDPDGMGHLALELDKLITAVEEGQKP